MTLPFEVALVSEDEFCSILSFNAMGLDEVLVSVPRLAPGASLNEAAASYAYGAYHTLLVEAQVAEQEAAIAAAAAAANQPPAP